MTACLPDRLTNLRCELGENPYWDDRRQLVYWTDITLGVIHSFDPKTHKTAVIYRGPPVGGFSLQSDGSLLLFRIADIAILRADGRAESVIQVADDGMERFNDVIADPEGRVFAGTIGRPPGCGCLYRIDRTGEVTRLFSGTQCSNGMGFNPTVTKFYWTCSTTNRIYQFDYNRQTGGLSDQRVLYQAQTAEGIADGLTVDAEGNLWSARWNGAAIIKHAPDGRALQTYPFPVAKVTSACFGGEHLDSLYVTTAGGTEGGKTDDGALFQLRIQASGRLEFKSRIFL